MPWVLLVQPGQAFLADGTGAVLLHGADRGAHGGAGDVGDFGGAGFW
jgi:hypothetical protein